MKNIPVKKKKVALYDPYLATMGGGERLILSILQVLDRLGFEIVILWDQDLTSEIQSKLGLTFSDLTFEKNFISNRSVFDKYRALSKFEMFFYVTDGSYFFSGAKRNFVYCMIPDTKLYNQSLLNRLKLFNYSFITISEFSKKALTSLGIDSAIIYPYLTNDFFKPLPESKDKIILSVGRFFPHLHSKRQDVAIQWFQDLVKNDPQFSSYKLILAGSLMNEDSEYFESLKQMAGNNPQIEFRINIPFTELLSLYDRAEFYWHFAGYKVDESSHPEQTEHLGITPMEAMARGCVTFAYKAGGPKEIIKDGSTGYLFTSQNELFEKMQHSKGVGQVIIENARNYVINTFSYSVFEKKVQAVLLP